MKDEPLDEVPIENLGPAMLAINAQQRKFVVGYITSGGKSAARVARAAGYSDLRNGSKVRAWELTHNPKVLAALKEEADRRMDVTAVNSLLRLDDLTTHRDPQVRQRAIDSVLDRRGHPRQTNTQVAMRVEHVDERSTLELIEDMRRLITLPVIETTAEVVKE